MNNQQLKSHQQVLQLFGRVLMTSSLVGQNNSSVASIVEMDKYLNESLLNRRRDSLKWWSERKHMYHRLYEMMKRRLYVPATSILSEL